MALKSANQNSTTPNAVPDAAALAVMDDEEENAVALVNPSTMELGSMSGEYDRVRIRLPYLQISHAMGKLEAFQKGAVLISPDNLIALPGMPVRLTILSTLLYYKEYVGGTDYDPNYKPKCFLTAAEVLKAGGTVDWSEEKDPLTGKKTPPTYKPAQAAKVIVQQPEGVISGLFGDLVLGGKAYAPCMWNVDKTAADRVLPVLKSDSEFSLKTRGIYSAIYELKTVSQTNFKGMKYFVPSIRLVDYHKEADVARIKELFAAVISTPIDITSEVETVEATA